MKDLLLQLEEAGFEFDDYYNKFIRKCFHEVEEAIEITDSGLLVSVCTDSSHFEDLATFQTLEEAINFLK
jgi:hypothetical protein